LIILAIAPVTAYPRKGALDYPANLQRLESHGAFRAAADLQPQLAPPLRPLATYRNRYCDTCCRRRTWTGGEAPQVVASPPLAAPPRRHPRWPPSPPRPGAAPGCPR